jgi:hypothetical protein
MVSPEDIMQKDPEVRKRLQPSLPKPCPTCNRGMVRSRDGRDLCVGCGYLQPHA